MRIAPKHPFAYFLSHARTQGIAALNPFSGASKKDNVEYEALSKYVAYLQSEKSKIDAVGQYSKYALMERRIDRLETEREAMCPKEAPFSNATSSLLYSFLPIKYIATTAVSAVISLLFLILYWGVPIATFPASWLGKSSMYT